MRFGSVIIRTFCGGRVGSGRRMYETWSVKSVVMQEKKPRKSLSIRTPSPGLGNETQGLVAMGRFRRALRCALIYLRAIADDRILHMGRSSDLAISMANTRAS